MKVKLLPRITKGIATKTYQGPNWPFQGVIDQSNSLAVMSKKLPVVHLRFPHHLALCVYGFAQGKIFPRIRGPSAPLLNSPTGTGFLLATRGPPQHSCEP